MTPAADDLQVTAVVAIPRRELVFRATRAGGPGGQHVNTSSTRVEIVWNVTRSAALSDEQRERALRVLAPRLDSEGGLRIIASDTRSQTQNRVLAETRLAELVRRAIAVPRPRRKTRPTRASVERRIETKRRVGEKKRERQKRGDD